MALHQLDINKQDILIIDDTPDNLRVLSAMLTKQGYNVRKALNWQMALVACQTILPDLILLDIMMPDVDGYQVCERLKSDINTSNIPVIFISALDDVFDKVKAFQAGGVDYITKPFEFEEVLVRVQNQLALRAANQRMLNLNSELEIRVKERTIQLETANQELIQEIVERKQLQNKLLHMALHDPLTGLPNRALFMQRLESALLLAQQDSNYQFAVLFLDCDRFKLINDSFGHLVGDELLSAIAKRLTESLQETDVLARLGGDEFAILLENIENFQVANQVAETILQQFLLPFKLSRFEVFINASIGIALGNIDLEKPEYILRDADTAMYRAKALGKGRYHVFNLEMHQQALQLLALENDLRRAIERQEFLVYYQPIVSLTTGKITSLEALVRWQHPQRGVILPTEFISVAEETGLITPINLWVLENACQQLRAWQCDLPDNELLNININLSARLFSQPNLLQTIDEIVINSGINPQTLKLEITESAIMDNHNLALKIIQQLQQREITIVIDDFGTGYSSLSYLHNFPVNAVKIDQSFIKHMPEQKEMGLVRGIIGIAKALGITAIAEGVETISQLTQLRSLESDFAQGYFFSPALPPESISNLLASTPHW